MRWWSALLLILISCEDRQASIRQLFERDPLWLESVVWQQKPDGLEGEFATGTILEFKSNGEFRMADATLTRWRGKVAISEGDGFVRYLGNWKLVGRAVLATYRVETPTRLLSSPMVKGETVEKTFTVMPNGTGPEISDSTRKFAPNRLLDERGVRFVLGKP